MMQVKPPCTPFPLLQRTESRNSPNIALKTGNHKNHKKDCQIWSIFFFWLLPQKIHTESQHTLLLRSFQIRD